MVFKKVKEFWSSLEGMTTVSKRELFLGVTTCTLTGVIIGIIFFPRHMMIGSNNGSNSGNRSGNNSCLKGIDNNDKHKAFKADKAACSENKEVKKEKEDCCKKNKKNKSC